MLRKALPEDLDFIYNLYMHPMVNPWLLYEPMSKEDFMEIYRELLARDVKYTFSLNDVSTGMVKLIPNSHRAGHIVYVGGLAIHPRFNGLGYGKQLINEVIGWAAASGFRRLELSVAASNEKAIRLYQQAGFQQEGILKDYTHLRAGDKYIDELMMALLI